MKFGSLFSGIGGFDLGLERAGMECAWQVEIDPHCRTLLRERFPHASLTEDVTHATGLEPVDLICGGFPCQDLSVAGKREGLAGERSGLWHQFHRILDELRPRWVVVENVPGLLSSNGGRDFAVILRGLVELGYCVSWRILDAQHFGLAQRRRRVFIVGSLGSGRSAQVLFESEGVPRNHPASGAAREGTAPTLASRTRGGGGLGTDAECDGALIVPAISAKAAKGTGGPSDDECQNLVAFTVSPAQDPIHAHGFTPAMSGGNQQGCATLGVQSATGVRRLTPRECSRLQGFPDTWLDEGLGFSDSTKYKMLGNACAVPVCEWIARRIT